MNVEDLTIPNTYSYPPVPETLSDSSRGSGDDQVMHSEPNPGPCGMNPRRRRGDGIDNEWKRRVSQKRDHIDGNGNIIRPSEEQNRFDALFNSQFNYKPVEVDVETEPNPNTPLSYANSDHSTIPLTTDRSSVFYDTTRDESKKNVECENNGRPDSSGVEKKKKRKGRPKGSRNKKNIEENTNDIQICMENNDVQEGRHFSAQEGLILAKAWIFQSMKGTNQTDETMWNGIKEHCAVEHKLNRTSGALKSKWCSLRRHVMIYLAAKEFVMNGNNSGRTEEELMEMAMKLFQARAGKVGKDGVKQDACAFKFLAAANYLSDFPKFGGLTAEAEETAIKEAMKSSSSRSGFDSNEEVIKYTRPKGVKAVKKEMYRKKTAENKNRSEKHKQNNWEKSTRAMHRLANGQERDRRAERNYRLLQNLPNECAAHKEIMAAMLKEYETEEVLKNDSGEEGDSEEHV